MRMMRCWWLSVVVLVSSITETNAFLVAPARTTRSSTTVRLAAWNVTTEVPPFVPPTTVTTPSVLPPTPWLTPTTGRALCLTAAALYGTNFGLVSLLDESMPLAVSATGRFGLAALVLLLLTKSPYDISKGFETGLWYAGGYLAQAQGLETLGPSKSAFCNALCVLVVPALEFVMTKQSGDTKQTKFSSSLLWTLGGVALMELNDGVSSSWQLGDVWGLVQALLFGIGYWRLEQVNGEATAITAGQLCMVTLVSGVLMVTTDTVPTLSQVLDWWSTPTLQHALLWTGLVSTAAALVLETVALQVVSASELTLLMTTVSLWGSAFGVYMGDQLPMMGWLGGGLIVGGCVQSILEKPVVVEPEPLLLMEPEAVAVWTEQQQQQPWAAEEVR